jgi:hypothetical protein
VGSDSGRALRPLYCCVNSLVRGVQRETTMPGGDGTVAGWWGLGGVHGRRGAGLSLLSIPAIPCGGSGVPCWRWVKGQCCQWGPCVR